MSIYNSKMWQVFVHLTNDYSDFKTQVKAICDYAIDRSKYINISFPFYTLHDETHMCHVLQNMYGLLGERVNSLSFKEVALLILSACCHDIGMSCSNEEKEDLINHDNRIKTYLKNNLSEYIKYNSKYNPETYQTISEETFCNFLRSIHHERIEELIFAREDLWNNNINHYLDRNTLVQVCKSHGENAGIIRGASFDGEADLNLVLCSVLLRLADIMDLDCSRAPKSIYEYLGFSDKSTGAIKFSKTEWDINFSSNGMQFDSVKEKEKPYILPFKATCRDLTIEQAVNHYLDWIQDELDECNRIIQATGNENRLVIPYKIKRNISKIGYKSGEFQLSLDKERILSLFSGEELYGDGCVFVRELLQNAIDAVCTMAYYISCKRDWEPCINISTWIDEEGYYWFRVDDNGIGMSEATITKYFLSAGSSFYISDEYKKLKIDNINNLEHEYIPISRFGVGLLSCFMDKNNVNRVELSTKSYDDTHPAIRMSMDGTNGYYYLASENDHTAKPRPMPGRSEKDTDAYRTVAGTSIAVRTDLYQSGKYSGFLDVVDKYVIYPPVPIHFIGEEGTKDYLTKKDFLSVIGEYNYSDDIIKSGLIKVVLPDKTVNDIISKLPIIRREEIPELYLKLVDINRYIQSPCVSGAIITSKAIFSHHKICFCDKEYEIELEWSVKINDNDIIKPVIKNNSYSKDITYAISQYEENNQLNPYQVDSVNLKFFGKEADEYNKYLLLKKSFYYLDNTCIISGFLCSLDFYKKYFFSVKRDVTSYNGILCGNAILQNGYYSLDNANTSIILTNGRYRPKVNIARNEIRSFPMELRFDLALIIEKLKLEGINCEISLYDKNLKTTPIETYNRLFQQRKDLDEMITVKTPNGKCLANRITDYMNGDERIEIMNLYLTENTSTKTITYILLCYYKLYLNCNFHIEISDKNQYIITVSKKSSTQFNPIYEKHFSPMMFAFYDGRPTVLKYCLSNNCPCNIEHPFAQFLINNSEELSNNAGGIFKKIIHTLLDKNNPDEIILETNKLIDQLKRISQVKRINIEIPSDLSLKQTDFAF